MPWSFSSKVQGCRNGAATLAVAKPGRCAGSQCPAPASRQGVATPTVSAGAIGAVLTSMGVSQGYYLFGAVPCVLTLGNPVIDCHPGKVTQGSPGELVSTR